MQITDTRFACEWCGREFGRRSLVGRRPLYCKQTCRQRAYEERRRGALYLGLPKPTIADPRNPGRPEYQAGRGGTMKTPLNHALRPDGGGDRYGARPTLCGATATPLPYNFFPTAAPHGNTNCAVCAAIATKFPPTHRIAPLSDVGTVTSLVKPLRSALRTSDAALRQQVTNLLCYFGAPAGAGGPGYEWLTTAA